MKKYEVRQKKVELTTEKLNLAEILELKNNVEIQDMKIKQGKIIIDLYFYDAYKRIVITDGDGDGMVLLEARLFECYNTPPMNLAIYIELLITNELLKNECN